MSKLFLFGIGGTGARVIKSLTMLLASGLKISASEVVPIIVDPHQSNDDLKRTVLALENYQAIYKALGDNRNDFFNTKITTLQNLIASDNRLGGVFSFNLKGVQNERFRDYIDYSNLDESNKALASLLFSEKNMETEMDIGFVGNPNIGSVVLNQFKESEEFKYFASNFDHNDRIFIVSSIFGGTGAAGFPLLLKNIRSAQPPLPNHAFLQDAKIGALTMLPYFGVEPDENNRIDKATFISKSKAALHYYERNVSGNDSVNALYYLGDDNTRDYTNDPGENGQKNDAHFVEVAAALSIIDFMGIPDESLDTKEGKAARPIYKEFGIKEDAESLDFTKLGNQTQELINKPLSQYMLFYRFLKDRLQSEIGKGRPFAERKSPKLDSAFTTSAFYRNYLRDFNQTFEEWMAELARNKRAFAPFNIDAPLQDLIKEIKPKGGFFSKKVDYNYFIDRLNAVEKGQSFPSVEQKFIALFHEATAEILDNKYDYFK